MEEINGDILKLCKKGAIMHQVNCQDVMGSGIAKAILKKYPKVKEDFHKMAIKYPNKKDRLGKLQLVRVNDDITVMNSFTQEYYGNARKNNRKYTLDELLCKNILLFDEYCKKNGIKGYIPKLIGCDLAGGDEKIIFNSLKKTDLVVVTYN